MKYIKYSIIALAALIISSSCSDALDQAPDGKISLDDVFADNDETMYYLNSCYASLPVKGARYFFWTRGPVNWCDESWDADDLDVNWAGSALLYSGSATASSDPRWSVGGGTEDSFWPKYFTAIRKCSYFLTRIGEAKVNDETQRSRWTAEAHVLRAFYYSELLKWFGCGLPIIREPYTFTSDFSQVTRGSYYDVVKFIMEDCDAALANNDLPWRITTGNEQLRMTKAFAEGLKARMILYAASPLYNDGENHWDEAYSVIKTSLANLRTNGYELYTNMNDAATFAAERAYLPNDYASLFNEYFCTTAQYSSTPVDKETIYQTDLGAQWDLANVDCMGAILGYKTGTCPTQELVDAFETTDGQPILDLAKPYNDEETHLNPNYNTANTLYDPQNPYENRDPRFYASIYYNGSKRYCGWTISEAVTCFENYPAEAGNRTRVIATWAAYEDENETVVATSEPRTGLDFVRRAKTRTGYYQRKFVHPNEGNEFRRTSAAYKEMRLAEIILSFAEAANEAGHMDEAYSAVNEIRSRVGMPNLPAGLSKDDMRLRIKNERRVEFALEGQRYFDVRRWSNPTDDLAKTDRYITAAYITHKKDGTYKYERIQVGAASPSETGKERLCYTNKFLKCAIPLSEINNMLGLTGEDWQNPGW